MEVILGKDEVKKIAVEHIVKTENVGDVEIEDKDIELFAETEPYIYKVQGIARRHATKQNIDYILAECRFIILISNRDKKIRDYRPSEWFYHYSVHDLLKDQEGYREV